MYGNSLGRSLPRRILITTDSIGETWPYSFALARGLAGEGIHVGLVSFGPRLSPDQRRRVEEQNGVDLFESEFSPEWAPGFWSEQHAAEEWLLQLAAQFEPDIVHLNGCARADLPWNRPTVVVAHRCMASCSPQAKARRLPRQWDSYRQKASLGLRSAGMVVSTSCTALARLQEQYGPLTAARVIRHGWQSPRRIEPKRGFAITAQHLWDESTNLQALELTAPFLLWPVFCAGETLDENGERAKVQARNMCCLGALSERELEEWLLQCSIFVLPARSADCEVSVLQAASAGCALVLGNHPVLREIWDDAAVFVPSEEPEAVRCALDRLILQPNRRNDLAERARRRAEELSLSLMTKEYCIAYQELMASGVRNPGVLYQAVGV